MTDQQIRLTFKGGGWVLVMTAIVLSGFIAWAIAPAIFRLSEHVVGDGKTVESYQFDLSQLQLKRDTVIPVMQHRNMSPVMHHPEVFTLQEIEARNAMQRDPYLTTDDLVVGDCYDYSVLEWDEEEQGYHWKEGVAHPGEEESEIE